MSATIEGADATAFVYVISAGDTAQKIGLTRSHPSRRLAALQTAHHGRLLLAGFAAVEGRQARQIERAAHALLLGSRAAGEWFAVSSSAAITAVEHAAGVVCEIPSQAPAVPSLHGAQIRAARALVGWSAQRLADTSGVGIATIWRAEKDDGPVRMIPANLDAITRTLEGAGVEFTNGGQPGVRQKAQP